MAKTPDRSQADAGSFDNATDLERELEKIQPALYAYVGSLTGGSAGVADVVQETNLLIWEKRDGFELGTNFKAWAFRIAYFKVLAHRRDSARRRKFVFNDELVLQLAEEAQDLFAEAALQRKEALEHCLGELGEEQRALLDKHYVDGVSLTDIAFRKRRKPDAVHKMISRIRLALRKCINTRLDRLND